MKLYRKDETNLSYVEYKNYWSWIIIVILSIILLFSIRSNTKHSVAVINHSKVVFISELDTTPLTKKNVWEFLNKLNILHPQVVYQQIMLETNNLTSPICSENNNIVGQRVEATNSDGSYRYAHYNIKGLKNRGHLVFANWKLSLLHYKAFQEHNYLKKHWNYYNFLRSLGYAEDPQYIDKLKQIKTP